jgi:subtilisin family serine protease
VARAARDVRGLPQVDTVALDLPIHADSVPNDEYWWWPRPPEPGQWGPQLIGLPAALDLLAVRRPVTVAIVDTGIDVAHPDLAANLWTNPGEIPSDGIDNDHNGYVDDVHGYDFANNDGDPMDDHYHGTHVSGTIGAVGNNECSPCGGNQRRGHDDPDRCKRDRTRSESGNEPHNPDRPQADRCSERYRCGAAAECMSK